MLAVVFFAVGIAVGIFAMQPSAAQGPRILALNHIAVCVENLNQTVNFYTKTLGFREAFSVRDPGGVRIELLQLGPDSLHRKAMNSWKP
mgnify:FL=1